MADAKRTIDLVFNGVDKTAAAVQSAVTNTGKFASGVQSASAPIANFSTSVLKYEAAILAAGAATAAFAVKAAGDFDGAFREITTLIDAPVESLSGFRQGILDFGASETTASLDDVTSALYTALSAGIEYTDSLEFLTTAEQLAVAGRAGLADSTNVLISSLNAYSLGTESATRFSDAFFATVKAGQVTLPELVQGFSQVTQSAATLDIPIETLGAAIATLTANGVPARQAFTQLRAVLAAMIKPSEQAKKAAAELGIDISAAAVKSKGFENVLLDIARATGGNEETLGRLIGSVEGLGASFTLLGNDSKQFRDNLELLNNSAGITAEAYGKMADSFEISNQRVANAFNGFLVSVGTPLLDEYGNLASAFGAVFNALRESTSEGNFGELIEFTESQLQALADTVATVAANLPEALAGADLSGFSEGITVLGEAFGVLLGDINLSSVEGLRSLIELAGSGFNALSQFSAGVIESFKPVLDLLRDLSAGVEGADAAFRDAGNIGGIAIQVNAAAGALASAIPVFEGAAAIIAGNQGLSLAKSAAAGAAALGGAKGLVPQLALLSASGAAGYGIGKLADEISGVVLGEKLSETLQRWTEGFGEVSGQAEELTRTLDFGGGIQKLDDDLRAMNAEIDKSGELVYNFSTGLYEVQTVFPTLIDIEQDWIRIQEATKGATDATQELIKKTEEVDPSIRIEQIKSATAIATTTIEADARKVVAAYESIGTSIAATTEAVVGLTGELGNENISKFDKLGIKDEIQRQSEQQQSLTEAQEAFIRSQTRENNARTRAFERGGALINIDGAGLQPHLEAFMFEILESLQVRVNTEGYNLLLGAQ